MRCLGWFDRNGQWSESRWSAEYPRLLIRVGSSCISWNPVPRSELGRMGGRQETWERSHVSSRCDNYAYKLMLPGLMAAAQNVYATSPLRNRWLQIHRRVSATSLCRHVLSVHEHELEEGLCGMQASGRTWTGCSFLCSISVPVDKSTSVALLDCRTMKVVS